MDHLRTMLNATTLAERWDSSPGHLANLRCQGRGPSFCRIGSRVLYPLDAVVAYEQARMVEPIGGAA